MVWQVLQPLGLSLICHLGESSALSVMSRQGKWRIGLRRMLAALLLPAPTTALST